MSAEWRQPVHDRLRRTLDLPMVVLSLGFVVVLIIPAAYPHLSARSRTDLAAANYGLWAAFAVEYVALVVTAPNRWTYVRRHPLDLLLVAVPFLRPLRALRFVRVLIAVGSATQRSHERLLSRTALAAAVVAVTMVSLMSIVVLDAERDAAGSNIRTFGDALWWAATTITTVGYGDHYPVTAGGRAVAVVLMVTGIALLGIVTAAVAAWFVRLTSTTGSEDKFDALRQEIAELRGLLEQQSRQAS